MRAPSRARWRSSTALQTLPALAAAVLAVTAAYAAAPEEHRVTLQADEVIYNTETGIVTATGHVEIGDEQHVLRADAVTYDSAKDKVGAEGHVTLTETNGDTAFAEKVELSGSLREGALQGFSALIGQNGRLAAVSALRSEGRYTEARGAVFTPCIVCVENGDTDPVWQIKALRVIHDAQQHELTFEGATLQFLGVPIMYLPVMTQADPTVTHKSGFLLPTIGSSTALGSFARVPYYFSLGPSRDFTVEPYLTTGAGTVVSAEFGQRWDEGGLWLQGSAGYDHDAAIVPGGSQWMSHLFGSGRTPLGDAWRGGFDVQLTSNDTYLRRYEISDLDRLTSDLFVDRVEGRTRAAVTGYFFQSLRAGDPPGTIPVVLPFAEYTYIPDDRFYGGRLRFDASTLALYRTEGTDELRGSASADWLRRFVTPSGQLLTFDVLARGDAYRVTDAKASVPLAPSDSETIGRGLGYAAAEWRWPFARQAGPGTTIVIEPIVQLVAASGGGNPVGLPNEDSTTFEFDETNLFNPNEFPGLDLWTGGPRTNAGVRATAFFPGGSLEGILGQDYRMRRDPTFLPGSSVGDERSDIVGRIKLSVAPYIDLVERFRIDPVRSTLRRNEVYVTATIGHSTFNLSYLKLSKEPADPSLGAREEVTFDTSINFYGYWSVFAEARRDLQQSRTLDSGAGIAYEDECFTARLGFRRRDTTDRDLRPSSSIILKIGLKTGFSDGAF